MDSFIILEGPVLRLLVAILIFYIVFCLVMFIMNSRLQKKNSFLKQRNEALFKKCRTLQDNVIRLEQKIYAENFKKNLSNLEVGKNV